METAAIRFPVSKQVRSHWEALDIENTDLFDRPALNPLFLAQIQAEAPGFDGDFLRLYLEPDNYQPAYSGESTTVKSGMRSPFMVVATRTYGFEAQVIDFRAAIYHILVALQDHVESQPDFCPTVTCLDSCAIDTEPDLAWGYTVRRGAIAIERARGLMCSEAGEGDLPISFGIRILFTEV